MNKRNKIPHFSCDVDVIIAFTPCSVLFRCLQKMHKIYKFCVLMCLISFNKSDVVKLTSFSTKKLLGVTSVTLI